MPKTKKNKNTEVHPKLHLTQTVYAAPRPVDYFDAATFSLLFLDILIKINLANYYSVYFDIYRLKQQQW